VKACLKDNKIIGGKLVGVNDEHIFLQEETKKEGVKDFKISYDTLEKIKVEISFK
jgi:hypothetical protein